MKYYSIGKYYKEEILIIRDSDSNDKNMQSGYRNGIWHGKTCHTDNENRKNIFKKTDEKELPN